MAVDFAKPACISSTNAKIFGICDDPPPSVDPAYLSYTNAEEWIVWVDNDQEKDITFTAIDHCIEILRPTRNKKVVVMACLLMTEPLILLS